MAIQCRSTSFEAAQHGFSFVNSFSGNDVIDETKLRTPIVAAVAWALTRVPIFLTWAVVLALILRADFWGKWGLCGGMCWRSLDFYYAASGFTASSAKKPAKGKPLFSQLVDRQWDAFGGWRFPLIQELVLWSLRPKSGHGINAIEKQSVGYLTKHDWWDNVGPELGRGFPVSLVLNRTGKSMRLWNNHFVVATGYSYDTNSDELRIDIYDPNHPKTVCFITVTLHASDSDIRPRHNKDGKFRGFFGWPYDRLGAVTPPNEATSKVASGEDEELLWQCLDF